jgi:hypothetical protein
MVFSVPVYYLLEQTQSQERENANHHPSNFRLVNIFDRVLRRDVLHQQPRQAGQTLIGGFALEINRILGRILVCMAWHIT